MELFAYGSGVVVLAVIWIIYGVLSRSWNPFDLATGADGKPSTSKLQWLLWTVVAIFAYAVIWGARFWKGQLAPVDEIPPNLMLAMGFSLTTMIAAKAITSAYVASGRVVKTNPTLAAEAARDASASSQQVPGSTAGPIAADASNGQVPPSGSSSTSSNTSAASGPGAIISDDDGYADLSKIQMLAWTIVAIGAFLISVTQQVKSAQPTLPDIDGALMVLMGLGSGAYLGKKLVTTTVPRLTGLTPSAGGPGDPITLIGTGFEDAQGGNQITMDGYPLTDAPLHWEDARIIFKIPGNYPGGGEWTRHPLVQMGVIVEGNDCPNKLPLTVQVPGLLASGRVSGNGGVGAVVGQLTDNQPANTGTPDTP